MNQSFVLITPAELEALMNRVVKSAVEDAVKKVLAVQDVEFLTVAQSAKMLRVSPETIYRMVDAHEVEFKMVGRTIRIVKQSLFKK